MAQCVPMTRTELPEYFTMEEASRVVKRSVTALRQLRYKGKGPRFHKVDGRLVTSSDDLAAWMRGEEASDTHANV